MTWPGFFAPSAAWLFLLAIPLVVLYFLKLKRPVLQVPSLALWVQVMQDRRVNSPFQRFRRNLLLWLQLLLLCLLVLAAMLPFLRGAGASARLLLMIDCSASMAALDRAGGESRLAVAKRRAAEIIGGLSPSQQAAIVTFGRTARQAVPFTSAQRVLLDGLGRIEIDAVESDPLDALRMADAMARGTPFDRVLLFSDGNVPPRVDFDLPFRLDFERLPAAGPNLGITGLRAQRDESSGWSVFVRVQGSAGADIPCRLVVSRDGDPLFEEPVHPGETGQRFVFPIPGAGVADLEFQLVSQGFDSLAIDDRAWLTLAEMRPLRVLLGPDLSFFEHALEVTAGVEVARTPQAEVSYDLVIARDFEGLPQALSTLQLGRIPSDLDSIVTVELLTIGTDSVVDWRRGHPLLEHVEMSELFIGEQVAWRAGQGDAQLDSRRYEVLAYGERGPLLVQKEDGGLLQFHMLFDPARSTLPYRVGFPIFCRNLVTIAMRRAGILEIDGARTGVLPPQTVLAKTEYTITGPGGDTRVESSDARGILRGVPAPKEGRYQVSRGGEPYTLGVSLLSSQETSLGYVDELQLSELSVVVEQGEIATDQSLWSWLAILALAVLLVEWWVYQARPGGYVTRGT